MLGMRDSLSRFAGGVYRRLFVLRVAEAAAMGFLAASAVAMPIAIVLVCRGEAVAPLIRNILGAGAAAGAIWRIIRRPRQLEALVEADRQLGLSDLLSTAWALRRGEAHGGAFESAVLSLAEARATSTAPSSIILSRLGRRIWGGAALIAALFLVLGLISVDPIDASALAANQPTTVRSQFGQPTHDRRIVRAPSRSSDPRVAVILPDRIGGNDDRALDPTAKTERVVANVGARADAANPSADSQGAGGGSARSNPGKSGGILTAVGTAAKTVAAAAHAAESSGGVGATSGDPSGAKTGASGMSAGANVVKREVAPWSMPLWAVQAQAADQAIRQGDVPADYQDLVREYFGR